MSGLVNLMVSTDISGKGGISTVLSVYSDSGFLERQNVRLIATHSSCVKGRVAGFFLYVFALLKLSFYLVFKRVGVVHVHMASRGSYFRKSLVIRIVKALSGKVILHLHGAEFREFYARECSKSKQNHIKKTFEMSDRVIVLSTQWKQWCEETLDKSSHVTVIYNAVPKLGLSRKARHEGLVVFLGRIGRRKGTLDLIRAFKKVKKSCPQAILKLGGDGEIAQCREEAKSLGISHSVEFLGWVSGKDKENLLAKSDVYCLPSYNEGFPMGVLEAMSATVPVVSSYAGGIPDAICTEEEGLLVEAGDVDGLAGALIRMINDRQLNNKLSEGAKKKFEENFSVEAIVPQLSAVYDELNRHRR